MSEVKNRLPGTNNLATNNGLTAVKYKISDHSKYITIVEFNSRKFYCKIKTSKFSK